MIESKTPIELEEVRELCIIVIAVAAKNRQSLNHNIGGSMRKAGVILFAASIIFGVQVISAQLVGQAHLGLKFFGIKGATTLTSGGTVSQVGNFDGGKTVFNIGIGGGYTILRSCV